jgi:hypothetical protein
MAGGHELRYSLVAWKGCGVGDVAEGWSLMSCQTRLSADRPQEGRYFTDMFYGAP